MTTENDPREGFADEDIQNANDAIDAENGEKSGTFKDQTLEYNKLAAAFGVRGYPSYLFFDKKGQPITVISNFFEKEKFIPLLDYFTKELYIKEVDLQKYVESNS